MDARWFVIINLKLNGLRVNSSYKNTCSLIKTMYPRWFAPVTEYFMICGDLRYL